MDSELVMLTRTHTGFLTIHPRFGEIQRRPAGGKLLLTISRAAPQQLKNTPQRSGGDGSGRAQWVRSARKTVQWTVFNGERAAAQDR